MGFRDRFFTRPVARAITSPLGIVLFGAATAVGIVAGLGFAAPLVGVAAWAARVLAAVPRRRGERIDAYALGEPWRRYVLGAQSAAARFHRTVAKAKAGPTRERLTSMAGRIDEAIQDCWRIAQHGEQLDTALGTLSTDEARAELAALKVRVRERGSTPATEQTQAALEAQIASADRLRATRQDAADRLRLLDARLDEIVARGVEVSMGVADSGVLDNDVTGLVTDLEALRRALEDVGQLGRPGGSPEPRPEPG